MKQQLVFVLSMMLLLSTSSCKKEDDSPAPATQKSKEELLVGKTWVLESATADQEFDWNKDGNKSKDIYSQIAACVRDNSKTFNSDYTTTSDEGASKCDPNDPQTWSGTWKLESNQIDLAIDNLFHRVHSISETNLSLERLIANGSTTITVRLNYVLK